MKLNREGHQFGVICENWAMATFSELGIDFPLFAADVDEAASWEPTGTCEICSEERAGFQIGIGDCVEVTCTTCGTATPTPADNRPAPCVQCEADMLLGRNVEETHGCWTCLRAGAWSSTKDTEAGMVTPAHASLGKTHGLPSPATIVGGSPTIAGWPASVPNEDGWSAAVIPSDVLRDLVGSPNYITWQGERWLFHCRRPMIYVGLWGKRDFTSSASDGDGRSFANASAKLPEDVWEYLSDRGGDGAILVYMFECSACGDHRGHWDTD